MKSTRWPMLGLVTVLVLLFGAFIAWRVFGFPALNHETQKQTYEQAISKIIFNDMRSNDITVHGRPGASGVAVERRLSWSGERPRTHETWNGDVLTITVDCTGGDIGFHDCNVDYFVDAPATVAIEAHLSSGDVALDNLTAPAVLDTSSGDVRVRDLTADSLDVRSTSGDLVLDGLSLSALKATATSGDIRATFTKAPTTVDVEATSGDVTVTMPRSGMTYKVRIETTSGDQVSDIANDDGGTGSIAIRATSGDVRLRLA
jgi:hypothetical protein